MSYFITKYALTKGIIEVSEDAFRETGSGGIFGRRSPKHFSEGFYGKDWHTTNKAALARAEEMRIAKIASLKKSIAKMEKLKF